MLSSTQQESFAQNGYLLMQSFFPESQQDEIAQQTEALIQHSAQDMPPEHVFCESKGDMKTLKQLQHLETYSPFFAELIQKGLLPDLAGSLLGSEVEPRNIQYFNKPPRTSQPTPPHQDGYYFMLEPCRAVTLWLALDPATQLTGGVRYVPGSHRFGLRPHSQTNTLGFSQGIEAYPNDFEREHETLVPAQPGDLLAHDALTVHRADKNKSTNLQRRALGFIYYDAAAKENKADHQAYQEALKDKLRNQGKI